MCLCEGKEDKSRVVGHLPFSYTAVSPGEAWLPQASEFGFSPPEIESGSHCGPSVP